MIAAIAAEERRLPANGTQLEPSTRIRWRRLNEFRELSRHNCVRCPQSVYSIGRRIMNGIIYLVGLVVVVMAILSFFGMH